MTPTKLLAAAALAMTIVLPAIPAAAGEAEVAYLERLAGQYTGKGNISGEDGGPVNCRLTFRPSGQKLNYNGRCSGGGGSQSFSGSIRYDDNSGKWLSSSRGSTVTGRRRGNTLTFTASDDSSRGTVSSTMTLSPGSITVKFDMRSNDGDRASGTIPFRRS